VVISESENEGEDAVAEVPEWDDDKDAMAEIPERDDDEGTHTDNANIDDTTPSKYQQTKEMGDTADRRASAGSTQFPDSDEYRTYLLTDLERQVKSSLRIDASKRAGRDAKLVHRGFSVVVLHRVHCPKGQNVDPKKSSVSMDGMLLESYVLTRLEKAPRCHTSRHQPYAA
jgi:hypothetical protein